MVAWVISALLAAQAANLDPKIVQHVRAGLGAREAGRFEEAVREFGEAARLAPNIAEIHLNLGLVQHQLKDWKAATGSFEAALKLKPDLKGVRDLLGFDYLMLGSLGPARQQLEQALAENSSNADAHLWLGLVQMEAGDFRGAIARLEEARKAKPKDPDLLFYLARAYERVSSELRQELLWVAPGSARAHMAAAEFAAFNGRTEEAIQEYQKVLALDPKMPGVHAAIGELHANDGEYAKAEESYRLEIALAPQNARVNYRYGLVLAQLGRVPDAIRLLQNAVDADPGLMDAHLQLGKALAQTGQLERAEQALLKVTNSSAPAEMKTTAHYQLTLLYRKRGQAAEAARHQKMLEQLRNQAK
ncbi:MAG: tetratricopeptide repeat protein [Bryobacteraceae bacterium]